MKRFKKALAIFTAGLTILTAVPLGAVMAIGSPISVSSSSEVTEGNFKYTVEDGETTITQYIGDSKKDVTVPDTLGGYPVTAIDDYAFRFCFIENLTIPSSVAYIGAEAFTCLYAHNIFVTADNGYFSSVDGVLFSKDKTELIKYPMCNKRTSYEIPSGVTVICADAFSYCSELTSVTVPDGVLSIGEAAFVYCTNITEFIIPNSVTTLEWGAFFGCEGLTEITLSDGIADMGHSVFFSCVNLANIFVSERNEAFSDIDGVVFSKDKTEFLLYPPGRTDESYTIPDGVEYIGEWAFHNCEKLMNITFPDSLAYFKGTAFYYCNSLVNIFVSDGNTVFSDINGVLFSKDKTELLSYPQGRTDESYTIPDGVKSIIPNAFQNCKLFDVIFPESVDHVGYFAFCWCDNLKSVTVPNDKIVIEIYGFYHYLDASLTFYGHAGSNAEKYALENGYGFALIGDTPQPASSLGDVNEDSAVDAADASVVLTAYALISTGQNSGLTAKQLACADVNGDGSVDATDASLILSYYSYVQTTKGTPVSLENFMLTN